MPSVPVMTRSVVRFPLSTCGLTVPTRSGAPAVSQVTPEMMSGWSATNWSIIAPVSFWLPATSRMLRVTGRDGVSGTPLPSADELGAASAGGVSELGAEHPATISPTAMMLATRYRGRCTRIEDLLSGSAPGRWPGDTGGATFRPRGGRLGRDRWTRARPAGRSGRGGALEGWTGRGRG